MPPHSDRVGDRATRVALAIVLDHRSVRRHPVGALLQFARAADGGIPFFYWYQFLWVGISATLTAIVYFATRAPTDERDQHDRARGVRSALRSGHRPRLLRRAMATSGSASAARVGSRRPALWNRSSPGSCSGVTFAHCIHVRRGAGARVRPGGHRLFRDALHHHHLPVRLRGHATSLERVAPPGYITAADFVRGRFDSAALALAVAVTGILATMPYIALQLVGIQVVLGAMGIEGRGGWRSCRWSSRSSSWRLHVPERSCARRR